MNNNYSHIPVLLDEVLKELKVAPNKKYIDCTLGAGGHSEAILKMGGKILGIEADQKMLGISNERLKEYCPTLIQGNFSNIEQIAKANNFIDVNGVLFDLGVSTYHYESLGRGFSINKIDEPLDMRLMPTETNVTAADLLNILPSEKLTEMFSFVLSSNEARQISHLVENKRKIKPFSTVDDLRVIVHRSLPEVFLALRIAVNNEVHVIEKALHGAVNVLAPNGSLIVISFHSGEDKLVLGLMKRFEGDGLGELITKKPIVPTNNEIEANAKSRSSLMRVFKKKNE